MYATRINYKLIERIALENECKMTRGRDEDGPYAAIHGKTSDVMACERRIEAESQTWHFVTHATTGYYFRALERS